MEKLLNAIQQADMIFMETGFDPYEPCNEDVNRLAKEIIDFD